MNYLIKIFDSNWRLFGTGLSFVVFGVAGLFLSVFVFPLLYVFIRGSENRQLVARRLVGKAFGVFIRMMRGLGVLSYEIEGLERAGAGHNQLIVANHPSLIDVVFLISLFPQADCVIKQSVIRNLFMRGVVLPIRYISSDDTGDLLESCVARLKSGSRLLLFPEGTRSVSGKPRQFKLGAASVAVRSNASILPVMISCTEPGFLAKHVPWYKVPPTRPFFSIQIQPALLLHQLIPANLSQRQATRSLNKSLLDQFENKLT